MKASKKLGRYKMYLNRLQTYMSMINFVMILYLYIIESPIGIPWYYWVLLMFVLFPILVVFDVKVIYPGTLIYAYDKNPGFRRLEKKVDKILEEKDGQIRSK